MLEVVFMNSKTHMVVIEVVSQHLDEHKNNGLIFKLQEILSGQIWGLQQEKYALNHILWIRMLGVVFMNSKTHMVVMKVVSQNLDEPKNNGLIVKLQEILSG